MTTEQTTSTTIVLSFTTPQPASAELIADVIKAIEKCTEDQIRRHGISKTDYGRMAVALLLERGLDFGQEQPPAAAAAIAVAR